MTNVKRETKDDETMSSNKVVSLFGGRAVLKDKGSALQAMQGSAQLDPRNLPDGTEYLNFSGKGGAYAIGRDREDVDPDEMWLVNIYSWQDGWICWKGSRPIAKRMWDVFGGTPIPAPDATELGPFDNDEGWSQAKGFMLKSLDSGVQAIFTINSKSGVSAFAGLQSLIADRMANDERDWPVVQLHKEKFTANKHVNYKPKFNVVGWLADEHIEKLGEMGEGGVDADTLHAMLNPDGAGPEKPSRRRIAR
jgi:hypothetical protein